MNKAKYKCLLGKPPVHSFPSCSVFLLYTRGRYMHLCSISMSPLQQIRRLKSPRCLDIKTLPLHIPLAEHPIRLFSSGNWKYRTVTTWIQKALQRRLRFLQNLRQNPRKRIRQEYFGLLVHRGKLRNSYLEVKVGKNVIVSSESTNKILWPLARVLELIPGNDGVVRPVRLKTAKGKYPRPV